MLTTCLLRSIAREAPITPGSSGSHITATQELLGKHVVFGRVVSGQEVVKQMEKAGAGAGVRIADCGELKQS